MKYVDLEDLVCYIDCYSKTYFDRKTYKLYYKRELTLLSRISQKSPRNFGRDRLKIDYQQFSPYGYGLRYVR